MRADIAFPVAEKATSIVEGIIKTDGKTWASQTFELVDPADSSRRLEVAFLVASGATYSLVPAELLAQLGIEPHSICHLWRAQRGATDGRDELDPFRRALKPLPMLL